MNQNNFNFTKNHGPDPDGPPPWVILHQNEAEYPVLLSTLLSPPKTLFLHGAKTLLNRPKLAIVGSRHPTSQGKRNAYAFAEDLSQSGYVIISGLAQGIDAAAHRGGLQGVGKTIAVMGTGIDRIYPPENLSLAQQIVSEGGLIISEFEPGASAYPWHFPHRNRLIAALSLGCLVVEATLDSGSLITAKWALDLGREIFALPGSIHSPQSKGCHQLIKEGAKLVENRQDILSELSLPIPSIAHPPVDKIAELPLAVRTLDEKSYDLWHNMGTEPNACERLAHEHTLTLREVSSILISLEIAGLVARLPGGLVQKLV